jgi:hypothetical protein
MAILSADVPLSILNPLFLIVVLNLIPLLIWSAWDLEQRRHSWLSRRQGKEAHRRLPFRR